MLRETVGGTVSEPYHASKPSPISLVLMFSCLSITTCPHVLMSHKETMSPCSSVSQKKHVRLSSLKIMNKETIQQLRQLPIEGVAERLGLRVTRHKSLCPFHDDHHASMTYSTSRNIYRCFACGAHGGTIDLVMRHLRKDFPDACRWLADSTNIIVEEYNPKTQNSKFKTPSTPRATHATLSIRG